MVTRPAPPIVVGVDDRPSSLAAAAWAGREAVVRRAPVRIVHAVPRFVVDVPVAPPGADEAAKALLAEAALRARAGQPRVEVATEVADGAAEDVLCERAADARLLVVGSRRRAPLAGLLLGSVSMHVVTHAPCPVVVVGEHGRARHGRIVVGVSGEPGQEPVLEFAFAEAAARGCGLLAVHAWSHPASRAPGDMLPLVYDVDEVGGEEARLLAEALGGRRERFCDVPVEERCVRRNASGALVDASAEADLVVVGVRGGGLTGYALGSTAHAVLRHAHCPVAVVRH